MPIYGIPTWGSPRVSPWKPLGEPLQESAQESPRDSSPNHFCETQSFPEYWSKLPAEIRLVILDMVVENYRFQPSVPYLRAGYATVCREWQPVFEQQNFRRLVLDYDKIHGLNTLTAKFHRRGYLAQIFLRVRLDAYDCSVCQTKESNDQKDRNNHFFNRSLYGLLSVLSQWTVLEPSPGRYGRKMKGLELELGAYSPSDYRHTFRDFHIEPNRELRNTAEAETYLGETYHQEHEQLGSLDDHFHGWVDGRRDDKSLICTEAKQRLMGTLEINWARTRPDKYDFRLKRGDLAKFNLGRGPIFDAEPSRAQDNEMAELRWEKTHLAEFEFLPEVEVVTSLLIRRQFPRKISGSSIGRLLKESFTNLREFRREGWFDVDAQQQLEFDEGFNKYLAEENLPSTLRNVYIFEESNDTLHLPADAADRSYKRSLGMRFSYRSHLLENISVAFLIDARDFFFQFWQTQIGSPMEFKLVPWENLRSLTLTSNALRARHNSVLLKNLLLSAGRAVAFMPELEMLEIWNAKLKDGDPTGLGLPGAASVFRYEYKKEQSMITFASESVTLHAMVSEELQGDVGSCWKILPRHSSGNQLNFKCELIREGEWSSWGSTYPRVMESLKLQGRVLHELSRCQMACENPMSRKSDTEANVTTADG
ncbi:hypothetical protein WAI453_009858 [Rhynchosporium graminicola]